MGCRQSRDVGQPSAPKQKVPPDLSPRGQAETGERSYQSLPQKEPSTTPLVTKPAEQKMPSGTEMQRVMIDWEQAVLESPVWELLIAMSGFLAAFFSVVTLLVFGLPAFIVTASLFGLGQIYQALGGSEEDWQFWTSGADNPEKISEECNRDVGLFSEALRGEGMEKNYWYHVRNNHPVLSLFLAERGHPFSPVERFGLLVLLTSFGYLMAGVKEKSVSPNSSSFVSLGYSMVCITLPSMLLQSFLRYISLQDYNYMLNKYGYFQAKRKERLTSFAKAFIEERKLAKAEAAVGKRIKTFFSSLADCCNCLKSFNESCMHIRNACEDGHTQAISAAFASLFSGSALVASALCIYFGIHLDLQSKTDVLQSLFSGLCLNFCCIWFLQAIAKFSIMWKLQHWAGRRVEILGRPFPPVPEAWQELDIFFHMVDRNENGSIDKSEAGKMVEQFLGQGTKLSNEGWKELLKELDSDKNNEISLAELQALRTEYARKAGWWHSEELMP